MRKLALILLCMSSAAQAEPVAAQSLSQARASFEKLRLLDAVQQANVGLEAGDATPDVLRDLYLVLGRAQAVRGDTADAVTAFSHALELAPGYREPELTTPRILGPLEKARAHVGAAGLEVKLRSNATAAEQVQTVAQVTGDPMQLVQELRLHRLSPTPAELTFARTAPPQLSWSCPAHGCGFVVTLHDRRGNTLRALGDFASPVWVEMPARRTAAPKPRPWYRTPWPYLGVGVALAGTTGFFAQRYFNAQSTLTHGIQNPSHTAYGDLQTADRVRRQSGPLALAAGAGTVGCAVGMALTW